MQLRSRQQSVLDDMLPAFDLESGLRWQKSRQTKSNKKTKTEEGYGTKIKLKTIWEIYIYIYTHTREVMS